MGSLLETGRSVLHEMWRAVLALPATPAIHSPDSFAFAQASDDEKNCHQLDLRPPVHVSATPGCEHLVSVALPRGLYTVVLGLQLEFLGTKGGEDGKLFICFRETMQHPDLWF